ncbi:MAG: T9SS type A sorting domain-containing protein [Bacteroidota bacterium]|nr:T9SS type A sorting domain-containing protein [Bacteroidota bacterium]
MKKYILLAILICMILSTHAQHPAFTRGAIPGELYIASELNKTDWMEADAGVFYSNDHGKNIHLMYSEPIYQDTTGFFPHLYADATQGVVYMQRGGVQDTLYMSSDHGSSWDPVYPYGRNSHFISGTVEGEIYRLDSCISVSNDYGQSFQILENDPVECFIFDIGVLPGQLWGGAYSANYLDILRMDNYSGQFNLISTMDTSFSHSLYGEISRGANPGELYFTNIYGVGFLEYIYEIYFSDDDGASFEHRFTSDVFNYERYDFHITTDNSPGTFYICRRTIDFSIPAWVVYIDYSCDTAKTFKTYYHILDDTVLQMEIKPPSPEISLYPNPFHQNTKISFTLNKAEIVSIHVYSIEGCLVKCLFEGKLTEGLQEIDWNGKDAKGNEVKDGLYFVRVEVGKTSKSLKIIKK